jgi:hypothetical protein
MPPGRPGGRRGHCVQVGGCLSGRLLLLGCGSLAREISLAIPLIASRYDDELTLMVAARDAGRARWLAQLVRARSFAAGVALTVRNYKLDWESVDQMAAMITAAAPTVILNTASLQSSWSLTADNAWSRLVRQAGYGVTVALQSALLPQLGRALRSSGSPAVVINACYPDVVNAGARRMGVLIRSGIGNIALVAEMLRQHIAPAGARAIRVLAGHWDVGELSRSPGERSDYPLVWLNGRRLDCERISGAPPLAADATLNAFGAGVSAALLCSLATGRSWSGHVPGPLGELGGYPIRLEAGQLYYDLPQSETFEAARAWNTDRCERDGAVVEEGTRLRFSAKAAESIRRVAPELAAGFDFKDVESAGRAFLELRDVLEKRS